MKVRALFADSTGWCMATLMTLICLGTWSHWWFLVTAGFFGKMGCFNTQTIMTEMWYQNFGDIISAIVHLWVSNHTCCQTCTLHHWSPCGGIECSASHSNAVPSSSLEWLQLVLLHNHLYWYNFAHFVTPIGSIIVTHCVHWCCVCHPVFLHDELRLPYLKDWSRLAGMEQQLEYLQPIPPPLPVHWVHLNKRIS